MAEKIEEVGEIANYLDKEQIPALKVLYDMAAQVLDRQSYCLKEWPKAYNALRLLTPLVYPESDGEVLGYSDKEIIEANK
jgi:hypothetical protein